MAKNSSALPVPRHSVIPAGQARDRAGVLSFFSGQERKGAWELPRHLRVMCVMGSVELDLREARIPEGESVIEIVAVLGSVEILVPPNVHLELDGDALVGEFSFKPDGSVLPSPGAPRITVRGSAIAASVECEARFAGESERQAKKRLKG